MAQMLTERYRDRLLGVLSCYDRIIITGTLPGVCYAAGMTSFLYARGIRIFDYARFAEPLRDRIRARAQEACAEAGIQIEHINKPHIRKEEVVAKVIARRGDHAGLVHVISAMEGCESYRPWHDKASGKSLLKPDSGKCLHYYFYFIDEKRGERDLARLTEPQREGDRTIKGLNFFERTEQRLLRALQRPEFNIHGMRRADLKGFLPELSTTRLSRQLHRLRSLGLIKRVTRTYRYYLTRLGRAAIAAACSLTQFQIIHALAATR